MVPPSSSTVQGASHGLFIVLFPQGHTRTLWDGDVPPRAPCPPAIITDTPWKELPILMLAPSSHLQPASLGPGCPLLRRY